MTTQQPEQPMAIDQLTKLVRVDLPADVQRLKSKPLPAEQLQGEIAGTVMFHQRSLGENMIQIRDWAAQYLFGMTAHLESIEDRLEELETEGNQGTQIEQEDADKLLLFLAGAKWLIEETQKTQVDPEAKKKLAELLMLGNECETLIRENVLIEVPEDEEGEEGEEGDEEQEDETEESQEPQ